MRRHRLLVAGLLMAMAFTLLPGCGGEGIGIPPIFVGLYEGVAGGDCEGVMRMLIGPNGVITGDLTLNCLCARFTIVGTYDGNGNITFVATGCGRTVDGEGTIRQQGPGSPVFIGSGTWAARATQIAQAGTEHGTWSVTRTSITGTL